MHKHRLRHTHPDTQTHSHTHTHTHSHSLSLTLIHTYPHTHTHTHTHTNTTTLIWKKVTKPDFQKKNYLAQIWAKYAQICPNLRFLVKLYLFFVEIPFGSKRLFQDLQSHHWKRLHPPHLSRTRDTEHEIFFIFRPCTNESMNRIIAHV